MSQESTDPEHLSDRLSRSPGAEVRVDPTSPSLLVAFSGLRTPSGNHYDLRRASDGLNVSRILLRDHRRSWYHTGIEGVGTDVQSVLSFLKDAIAAIAPERIVTTGASAGGYAAMLFGDLLGANEVHAFAPQTFLGLNAMRTRREPRWRAENLIMEREGRLRPEYASLAEVLDQSHSSKPIQHVWFDPGSQPDAVHVRQVQHVPRVRLHALARGDHDVAEMLANRGDLVRILTAATRGEPTPSIEDQLVGFTLPARVPYPYLLRRRARIERNRVMVRLGKEPQKYY